MLIKAITLPNGIACLSNALTTNQWLSSSHESNQELACMAISNIISGDKGRIQTAIDNNIVPCLAQMLTAENKKHALWTIYQITKAGNAAQVVSLVKADFVSRLCEMLSTDCSTTIMALWTLKNVSLQFDPLGYLFLAWLNSLFISFCRSSELARKMRVYTLCCLQVLKRRSSNLKS